MCASIHGDERKKKRRLHLSVAGFIRSDTNEHILLHYGSMLWNSLERTGMLFLAFMSVSRNLEGGLSEPWLKFFVLLVVVWT